MTCKKRGFSVTWPKRARGGYRFFWRDADPSD
jgi:hypothetical protein